MMDPAQHSTDLVSRKADEITEVKHGESSEQTTKSQSHNDDQSMNAEVNRRNTKDNPARPSSDGFSRREDEITEVKQGDPSGEAVNAPVEVNRMNEENRDHVRYRLFYKAVQENDWKGIKDFITKDPQVLTARFQVNKVETIFHVISLNLDVPFWIMEKLTSMVSPESLEQLKNHDDASPVFYAALNGNATATKAFVRRNKNLPNIRYKSGLLPIHVAARHGHKEVVEYLLSVTRIALDDEKGVGLLQDLIKSGLYGISVQEERIRYLESMDGDMENPVEISNGLTEFTHLRLLRQISSVLVPGIKFIRDTKLTNMQALEIVRIMCHEGVIWSEKEAQQSLVKPVNAAAILGIYEIVKEIMKAYFYIFVFRNKNKDDTFRIAILNRKEKVFSLINKKNILLSWDKDILEVADLSVQTDNILHLAGNLVPSSQISGAALQMQRELQWFKAVESSLHPSRQEQRNTSNKTPREVFTNAQKGLVKEGEKWMKDTASSCSVVAELIITVVFAAAFTVPGGNDSNEGTPVFLHKPSFIVFVISDALALFSATASVLMFLAIFTSRYSEDDFLESLPKKLIIGLITLFVSIASMMVAFGATIYIFLSHSWKWTIIPISLLGCLPVNLFALLQFPLLVEVISSTYGPSIFQSRN